MYVRIPSSHTDGDDVIRLARRRASFLPPKHGGPITTRKHRRVDWTSATEECQSTAIMLSSLSRPRRAPLLVDQDHKHPFARGNQLSRLIISALAPLDRHLSRPVSSARSLPRTVLERFPKIPARRSRVRRFHHDASRDTICP
ncbi:hypothetical protein JHW43_003874 [Diplocarpon mali]|nr:hypothetical protein JHW43_003874 [Diplocarpon mali]